MVAFYLFRTCLGRLLLIVGIGLGGWFERPCEARVTNILTGFEASEGYDSLYTLSGQQGWMHDGSGGNGLVSGHFVGLEQSAYVGFFPPDLGGDYLTVWKPIASSPLDPSLPIIRFSVIMNIITSSSTNWDTFRWSVYNRDVHRLFSIEFDERYLDVAYLLDGNSSLQLTDLRYTNDTPYVLNLTMNLAANRWSATFGGKLVATNQLITTTNAALNVGDIDAVWLINNPVAGDNYMVFDNYVVTAEPLPGPQPIRLQFLQRTNNQSIVRMVGQPGAKFALEATTNFVNWTALKTNTATTGCLDFTDTTSATLNRRSYRGRLVP